MIKALFTMVFAALFFVSTANAQTHNHKLTIENTSSDTVYNVYISRASSTSWGSDRLGSSGVIYTGYSSSIYLLGHVRYDVKIVEEDGQICTVRNFILDRDLTVRNTETSCGVVPVGYDANYN